MIDWNETEWRDWNSELIRSWCVQLRKLDKDHNEGQGP